MSDEETWPAPIRALFEKHFESLRFFEEGERWAMNNKYKNWPASLNFINPSQEVHDSVLARANDLAAGLPIVGRHCTRLHAEEIAEVFRTGLSLLSLELLTRRVRARVAAGDFSPAQGERLIATNYANDHECGKRLGMTWFVLSVDLEENQDGVEDFFRYWGGESLYRAHHEDEEVRALLRSVGTPCIVEATLPSEPFTDWPTFGARLYEAYMGRRGARADGGWEGPAKAPVRGDQIRRIIQLGDPLFESLTGSSRWESPLT